MAIRISRITISHCIGILFLLLQLGLVINARFAPERFFCWAPYDSHVQFKTSVEINGKFLTLEEAEKRYKYKMGGWEQRSIYNIFSIISQYEKTYGKNDDARVTIIYSINGHQEKVWDLKP